MVRFGPYEVRPSTRELFRHGLRIKLPPQAFEVLRVLLERRGELVTRQEFHRILWPADTFVDFDQGLNNAIKRIREVLNDEPDSPRYVETLPRLGYRFIGIVDSAGSDLVGPAAENGHAPLPAPALSALPDPIRAPELEMPATQTRRKPLAGFLLAGAAGIALLAVAWIFRPYYPKPRITREIQLTADGIPKWGPLATDGVRVYFTEKLNGRETIAAVPVSGGQAVLLKTPFAKAALYDISPDRNDLLVAEKPNLFQDAPNIEDSPLWRVPVIGGTPRRLGNIAAHDATWSPDGTRLAYMVGGSVYVANADGSSPRRLLSTGKDPDEWAWRPTWSSDSRRLRFDYYQMDLHGSHIWEVNADGTNPHPLFAASEESPMQSSGEWTPDGSYFLFSSWKELQSGVPWPAANLWAVREKASLFHRAPASPTSLTTGPVRYYVHTLSHDGKTIFALSSLKHGELMSFDPHTKTFSPWASGLSAEAVTFSRDGKWMAYVTYPQGELWRSRIDGSELLRLSSRPMFASSPMWSPDGRQIAFGATRAGENWYTYIVPAEGGEPQRISSIVGGGDTQWSPDGNSLVYLDHTNGDSNTMIKIRSLQTGADSSIAGSRGMWGPRISPDGRWITGLSNDLRRLSVYDLRTRRWRELASANFLVWVHWAVADSTFIYVARLNPDPAILRVPVSGGKPELVVDLRDFRTAGVMPGWFTLAPNGDILLLHDTGGGTEIYALSLEAP